MGDPKFPKFLFFHKPKKTIPRPHIRIVPPAIAWLYFSNIFVGNILIPKEAISTTASMVRIVTRPKALNNHAIRLPR